MGVGGLMSSGVWRGLDKRSRTRLLLDFDQEPNIKKYNKLRLDKQEVLGQARSLIKIEKFFDYVVSSDKPAYKFRKKTGINFSETRVGKELRKVYPLHFLFGTRHVYSEKPAVFLQACWQANKLYNFEIRKPVRDPYSIDVAYAEAMNFIVEAIRFGAKENWFKREVANRRYRASCNGVTANTYVAAILNRYARTEVVRLDVGYIGSGSAQVSIDLAWSDFNDFLDLFDYHPLFEHMTGYMWSIEQAEGKGYHMHLVFFFNGSEVCQDIVKAKLIGELWVERITRGKGEYYNCNMHPERYHNLGIGTIHRNNAEECMNAIRYAQYIPKGGEFLDRDDQYLRIKNKKGMRTFGTGQAPTVLNTRAGRPALSAPWLLSFSGEEVKGLPLLFE